MFLRYIQSSNTMVKNMHRDRDHGLGRMILKTLQMTVKTAIGISLKIE